jgi:phosphate starvation-inducible PhoH-like protein
MSSEINAYKVEQTKLSFELSSDGRLQLLCGNRNQNLRFIEKSLNVQIHLRGRRMTIHSETQEMASDCKSLILQIDDLIGCGHPINPTEIERCLRSFINHSDVPLKDIFLDRILETESGVIITPKTLTQKAYVDAIRHHDIVFGVGPAGTGKTYLAMAMALEELIKKKVKKIILTRPAVEAGERLGFLPGDLAEKVNPYLRPLHDAMNDMMDYNRSRRMLERGEIEVAPLAFMRGRTLNDSFVILDEAQNTTREQMKMFLTRLGYHSKTVITGDVTQIDLPDINRSGLTHAVSILKNVEGIHVTQFREQDVVRHPLVMNIIRAYDLPQST